MDNTASDYPYQSILDNCDIQTEHLTVEVIEKESVDTSHLSTRCKTKAEALALFTKEQLLLNSEQNQAELEHFRYVVAVAAGRIIASKRPDAKKLADHLPFHHQHENSNKKLSPATTFILKPYPYQETKNPDTIKLMVRIQRQFLQKVGKTMLHDPEFAQKLKLLEDPDAVTEEREAAEQCVREAVQQHGEWLGGGDLLTVKMIQEARMLMVPKKKRNGGAKKKPSQGLAPRRSSRVLSREEVLVVNEERSGDLDSQIGGDSTSGV